VICMHESDAHILKFREKRGIENCTCCGRLLKNTLHHFLCHRCHNMKNKNPLNWKYWFKITHKKYYKKNIKKSKIEI
jgi:hypothetical protein